MIDTAFSSEGFRDAGHRLIDQLADYLDRTTSGGPSPVLPWLDPRDMLAHWQTDFSIQPRTEFAPLIDRVLAEANHLHHPHYMGHQVPPPLPLAALCDLVASLLNNGMAVYEMGPTGTAMEFAVVRWMARTLGLGDTAGGFLTSGGSLANLTALLAAHNARNSRCGDRAPALLVSDQAHYSVLRAVKIMGWGQDGAIAVPSDDRFRLRPDSLEDALCRAESAGRRVFGVVASACTTATGSFDPLRAVAAFCDHHDLWLHVDAAHGAPAALSNKYRHLLDGIEYADSVAYDAHKMLLMPALVSGVIFRNGNDSHRAFEERAAYLLEREGREEWYNLGHRTLECTKRMASLKVYACLAVYGTKFFADYVTRMFDLGQTFADQIESAPDFELAIRPDANIACFRYVPPGATDLDSLQAAIRERLVRSGNYYIVQTRLPKGLYLRVTLLNPLIGETHLTQLLKTIRRISGRPAQ
jgi:L-2,4-diaminobutyrate decarboxylase